MKRLIKVLRKAQQEVIKWLPCGRGFFGGIKEIGDSFRFSMELADFRAPVADRGQDHEPIFVDHQNWKLDV